MKNTNRTFRSLSLVATLLATLPASRVGAAEARAFTIEMAILLDTSGSMSGLIAQAKSELWRVVNEFATARQEGKRADLRVALYEYGNNGLSSESGWVRRILPLTNDLDAVSEQLFALTTNGGNEYCGRVIQVATRELDWSSSADALKTIFIAGNEPFTQGDVDYRVACKEAISRGITVNTIHCGPFETGVSTMWKDGALLADGGYLNIDQNRTVAHIDAPQDREIARLGVELNSTYIAYGSGGRAGRERQAAQDRNASGVGKGSSVQRAVSKSGHLYCNTSWDLVDACRLKKIDLEKIKKEDLPGEMQKMTLQEMKEYVDGKQKEREKLQKEIQNLNVERQKFVAEERKKLSKSSDQTLDSAIIKCVREQAAKKNIRFEESRDGNATNPGN